MTSTAAYPAAATYGRLLDHANRPDPYPWFAELAREPVRQLDEHIWLVTRHAVGREGTGADPGKAVEVAAPYPDTLSSPMPRRSRPSRRGR
jgi:hypothetical protein